MAGERSVVFAIGRTIGFIANGGRIRLAATAYNVGMEQTGVADAMVLPARLAALEAGYGRCRLLSVDVALAALGGGVMACRLLGAWPHRTFFVLLPLSVWTVYTMDHLLDARRMGLDAATPRHRFHRRHLHALALLCGAAMIACLALALAGLSWIGVGFGVGMFGLFVGHELLVKLAGGRASPLLMKELGVAVVFTAGAWGLPWMLSVSQGRPIGISAILACVQYLLLALVNLIEFSIFEQRLDAAAGQTSFVLGIGRRRAGKIAGLLLILAVLLGAANLLADRSPPVLLAETIFGAMAVGLGLILLFPRRFARCERYRLLGDGVFLLPMLMAFA